MRAQTWFDSGSLITINGHQIFYRDSGIDDNKPTLVILHGYPTSSYDYYKVLPALVHHFRVIVHDHLGFGYSAKPSTYSYSLIEQADQALLLWQKLGIHKAHILAHDYGTSIATEIIARDLLFRQHDFTIESMTLCNGSMHIEMAKLRVIQKLLVNKLTGPLVARLSSKNTLKRNLRNIFFNPEKIDAQETEAIWSMMLHNNGRSVLHQLSQYIVERHKYWHRWIGALKHTRRPIHVVWAANDPIAVIEMAHQIHHETQNSQLTILDQLGHFPMLEDPQRWTEAVINAIKTQ